MSQAASQPPWIEQATIQIDLERSPSNRYDVIDAVSADDALRLMRAVLAEFPAELKTVAPEIRRRTNGRFDAEAAGIANRIGVDPDDVLLANVAYDLAIATIACSTAALPTPEGPVLARNMDWWPEDLLARASRRVQFICHGCVAFENLGWPGAIGVVTGMSARGFAVAINAVIGPDGIDVEGQPALLTLRHVLETASGFDEARSILSEAHLAAPALFTLVGTKNDERVVIERSPGACALRRAAGDGPLIATNDYRRLFPPQTHGGGEISETTCARFDALSGCFAGENAAPTSDAALLYVLTDARVIQGITAQHIIMRPATGQARMFVPRRLIVRSD